MWNPWARSAVRAFGRHHGPGETSKLGVARAFSTTPVHGVKAIFTQTGHTALDDTLKHIQDMIILPAYLPEKQRKLVFDPKKATELEKNPVIIEVEGFEHRFVSINRFKDIKNSKEVYLAALKEMLNTGDWTNLDTLLAGYRKAGIKLRHRHERSMIAKAGSSGHIYTVIECAKQADETGFKLDSPDSVAQVLGFLNDEIAHGNLGLAETKQALRLTDIVLDLVQRQQDAKPWTPSHGTPTPPQFSLMVRGLALYARASAYTAKQQAGEATEKDLLLLKDETELLSSLWTRALSLDKEINTDKDIDIMRIPEFATLCPKDALARKNVPDGLALSRRSYVKSLTQTIKGIELAEEAVEGDMGILHSAKEALDEHLKTYTQNCRSYQTSWGELYESVLGRQPDWPGAVEKTRKE